MNALPKNQMPGPATVPGAKSPNTKPERKAPTADAADTHTRKRDEVQLPPHLRPSPKTKNR